MKPKRILLVEDEKPLVKVLTLKLQTEGYEVVNVLDGSAAVEAVKQQHFDLMILDLIMPKKDGFHVLTEIQTMGIKLPILVFSNLGQEEDLEKAKKLGALDYFIKSNIPLSEVVEKVKFYLH